MGLTARVLLFIFVSHLFVLPEYARDLMILNLGWGNIYPLRLYTVGLPALYAFHLCRNKRKFRAPHLGAFALLFASFVLLEFLPGREGQADFSLADMIPFSGALFPGREKQYSFALEQFNIYVYFLILVNFGLNRSLFYKVVDYALYAGLIMCLITYIGYAGIINLGAEYTFMEGGLLERPDTLINADNMAYIAVFSMLLLIIKQLNEKRFSLSYVARDALLIALFLMLVVINSSRGAFIISMLMLAYYGLMLWRFGAASSKYMKYIIFSVVLIVITSGLYFGFGMPASVERSNLYQRSFVLSGESTGVNMRLESMGNSIENFKEHPLFGVGYWNAARSEFGEGTRDNNQFLQMLAGGGIFFFLVYVFYNYRFLACKPGLLGRPEVVLSIGFQFIFLQLSRPCSLALLSISAYIAIYFYYTDAGGGGPAGGQAGKSACK